jgi:hypothetical protein
MMKIIYPCEGGVSVLAPSLKFLESLEGMSDLDKMKHLANKDLLTGTPFEIVDEVPSDRTFRNAWEYVAGEDEQMSEDLSTDYQELYEYAGREGQDADNSQL